MRRNSGHVRSGGYIRAPECAQDKPIGSPRPCGSSQAQKCRYSSLTPRNAPRYLAQLKRCRVTALAAPLSPRSAFFAARIRRRILLGTDPQGYLSFRHASALSTATLHEVFRSLKEAARWHLALNFTVLN